MSPNPPSDEQVVRVRRLEIVDAEGRVRAVVGDLAPAEADAPDFGLALLDAHGARRAWVSLGPHGPVVGLDHSGNSVAEMGVTDAGGDALGTGAYLVLSDATGGLAIGWWVEEDGSVTIRTAPRR
ncbi:MAG TPA: hypothetical protein VNA57_12135 [Acidimicrobiales bacterium]|nr:hypothetical protein [Acidimicrobiales bacterium]